MSHYTVCTTKYPVIFALISFSLSDHKKYNTPKLDSVLFAIKKLCLSQKGTETNSNG